MIIPVWLNPVALILVWIGLAFASWSVPEDSYLSIMRSYKYVDGALVLNCLMMLCIFALGALLAIFSSRRRPRSSIALERAFEFLLHRSVVNFAVGAYIVTIAAYLLAFGSTLSLATVESFKNGSIGYANLGNQVPGVTTATQLGIFVVTYCSLVRFSRVEISRSLNRWMKLMIWSLIGLSAYRALLWHERLAVIEVVVPILVVYSVYTARNRTLLNLAPLFAVAGAIALFGLFEYFRSWEFYRSQYSNIVVFSTVRFASYYYTAFNNFGMAMDFIKPTWQPIWTLDFLYRFPIPGNPLLESKAEANSLLFGQALRSFANLEFNLYGGIGFLYLDFGVIGGSLISGLIGFISGRLFNAFRRFAVYGLIIYPFWMVGILDFGRILYWPSSRAFPAWCCILILLFLQARYVKLRAKVASRTLQS
ncbi:O-antigen polymerase [Pseudoroseicyclus sp. CXY001]|uniref:O-antigen polymerase n=1 Tax=Pseudoroseicyclus sp. CXY001 TaxID=3242492 RepID=UPI003570A576